MNYTIQPIDYKRLKGSPVGQRPLALPTHSKQLLMLIAKIANVHLGLGGFFENCHNNVDVRYQLLVQIILPVDDLFGNQDYSKYICTTITESRLSNLAFVSDSKISVSRCTPLLSHSKHLVGCTKLIYICQNEYFVFILLR